MITELSKYPLNLSVQCPFPLGVMDTGLPVCYNLKITMKRLHYSSLFLMVFILISSISLNCSATFQLAEGEPLKDSNTQPMPFDSRNNRTVKSSTANDIHSNTYDPTNIDTAIKKTPDKDRDEIKENYFRLIILLIVTLLIIIALRKFILIVSTNFLKGSPLRIYLKSFLGIRMNGGRTKIQNYWYLGFSFVIGILLGWYFKSPNTKLIIELGNCDSLWRKDLVIEYYRNQSSFFSADFFTFNWTMFLLSTLFCSLLLLFFNDKIFRQYLYNKISFHEEKKTTQN